jgi:hypothetical protein
MLPARVKLKLLVLEADEEQLDRIIQTIQTVMTEDTQTDVT